MVRVTFIDRDGCSRTLEAEIGLSLLDLARREGLDLEGACDGSLACSTCHLVVAEKDYPRLPPARREERDTLVLAGGLTPTSRLGCQIRVTAELEGLTVALPDLF